MPGELLESTHYYARPGLAARVLEQRLAVTRIRQRLGLPPGSVLAKLEGDGPDVSWMCEYASRDDYALDRARRETSAEFRAARDVMHTLLLRFERHLAVYAKHPVQ